MIGTFSLTSGRTISAQIRPSLVGTLTVSSRFAACAGAAAARQGSRRAGGRRRRMRAETPPRPESGGLGDDREVLGAQRVARLEHVVDVVAVDLEGDRALVERADPHPRPAAAPGDGAG